MLLPRSIPYSIRVAHAHRVSTQFIHLLTYSLAHDHIDYIALVLAVALSLVTELKILILFHFALLVSLLNVLLFLFFYFLLSTINFTRFVSLHFHVFLCYETKQWNTNWINKYWKHLCSSGLVRYYFIQFNLLIDWLICRQFQCFVQCPWHIINALVLCNFFPFTTFYSFFATVRWRSAHTIVLVWLYMYRVFLIKKKANGNKTQNDSLVSCDWTLNIHH